MRQRTHETTRRAQPRHLRTKSVVFANPYFAYSESQAATIRSISEMQNMNPYTQNQPSADELRAQIVGMLNQMDIPVPPAPDFESFRGQDPDNVHELMHLTQSESMARNIQLLATDLTTARDALESADEDHDALVEQIDQTLSAVSIFSLTTSKTVLDLQEIEKKLRESDAPMGGQYL